MATCDIASRQGLGNHITNADDFGDEQDDQPRYRDVAEILTGELYEALASLAGFAENPYLAMQAHQLCLVDNILNALEQEVMRYQFDDERTSSIHLNALHKMLATQRRYEWIMVWSS